MAVPVLNGKTQFFDRAGVSLGLGSVSLYVPGTLTPKQTWQDQAKTILNTTPTISLDAGGYAMIYGTGAYRQIVKDVDGNTIWDQPAWANDPDDTIAAIEALYAAASGAGLVGFSQSSTYAVSTLGAHDQNFVCVTDAPFNAKGDGTTDDTAAIQAAINFVQAAGGGTVRAPAGTYKITGTITHKPKVSFLGEGANATILNLVSGSVIPAMQINLGDNSSYIGGQIGGFQIVCNGGAAVCDGIKFLTTATNSAISQSKLHNIYIRNCRDGVVLDGVIYMCDFEQITVNTISRYGWFADSGFEIIYNRYSNLEATDVGDGAYAYYVPSAGSQWSDITADGCCYFAGAYTAVRGLSVEGMHATTPPVNYVVQLNQVSEAQDIAIINIPNSKCSVGIQANGTVNILGVRFPDAGAGNQPNVPILFSAGSSGLLAGVQMVNCVSKLFPNDLYDVVAIGCDQITNFGFKYTTNSWTPTFPAGWTSSPTLVAANYTRNGNMITAWADFSGGNAGAGATIGGLPLTSSMTQRGSAFGGCSDPTKRIAGTVQLNSKTIINIPTQDLSATVWQICATYPVFVVADP